MGGFKHQVTMKFFKKGTTIKDWAAAKGHVYDTVLRVLHSDAIHGPKGQKIREDLRADGLLPKRRNAPRPPLNPRGGGKGMVA